jgi:hypothetical protein
MDISRPEKYSLVVLSENEGTQGTISASKTRYEVYARLCSELKRITAKALSSTGGSGRIGAIASSP